MIKVQQGKRGGCFFHVLPVERTTLLDFKELRPCVVVSDGDVKDKNNAAFPAAVRPDQRPACPTWGHATEDEPHTNFTMATGGAR